MEFSAFEGKRLVRWRRSSRLAFVQIHRPAATVQLADRACGPAAERDLRPARADDDGLGTRSGHRAGHRARGEVLRLLGGHRLRVEHAVALAAPVGIRFAARADHHLLTATRWWLRTSPGIRRTRLFPPVARIQFLADRRRLAAAEIALGLRYAEPPAVE